MFFFELFFFVMFLLVAAVLLPILWLAGYLVQAIVLHRLAKQTGACKAAFAWIPVVQAWVLGKCAEACSVRAGGSKGCWGKIMLIFKIVSVALPLVLAPVGLIEMLFGGSFSMLLITLSGLALNIVTWICAYKIYHYYISDPADIIVTLLHTQFGWLFVGLFVVSFILPSGVDVYAAKVTYTEKQAEPAVVHAEEEA